MSVDPPVAAEHPPGALPVGTRLGEFELTRVLGVGGFGIVYLAFDHALHREVAVKEYMPVSLAGRTETHHVSLRSQSDAETFALGLRSFVNEARLLARFDHPSLVKVHRFWEAHNTAYMAMPVYRGQTLKQVRSAMAAPPDETWLRAMLVPLLGAIDKLHGEGVFHRDIAPDNIVIEPDGRPVLLDFGAARHVIGDKSQALTAILKPAYAPIEQYGEAGSVKQGPWTDLYALGATLHFMLLGRPPPPATARAVHDDLPPLSGAGLAGCSERFLQVIDWMLAPRPADRPQSVAALLDALDGRAVPPQRAVPVPAAPTAWPATQVLAAAPGALPADLASAEQPERTVVRPGRDFATAQTAANSAAVSAAPARPAAAAAPARSRAMPVALGAAVLVVAAAAAWLVAGRTAPVAGPPAEGVAMAPAPASASVVPSAPVAPAVAAPPPPAPATVPSAEPPVTRADAAPAGARVPGSAAPEPKPARPAAARPLPATAAPAASPRLLPPVASAPAAAAPAPAAAPPTAAAAEVAVAPAAGPKQSCGSRVLLALWNCVERQCRKAEFRQHPECVEWRQEQERKANPTQ